MKVNFHVAEFLKSAVNKSDHCYDLDQVLFIGKSNVGKSSLINALTNHKNLAYISKKPGQTKLINYYLIDKKFYLVDAPGFGYRKLALEKDDFDKLMNTYLDSNPRLKLIVYLLDSRRDFSIDEEETINYLNELGYQYLIVFTKCDKLIQSQRAKLQNVAKKIAIDDLITVSINNPASIENLRKKIITYIE